MAARAKTCGPCTMCCRVMAVEELQKPGLIGTPAVMAPEMVRFNAPVLGDRLLRIATAMGAARDLAAASGGAGWANDPTGKPAC